jgi:hypothetical protein
MLLARRSRYIGGQKGPKLAGVEVTPAPALRVVAWARGFALGASCRRVGVELDEDFDLLFGQVEVDVRDSPREVDAEDLGVELVALHDPMLIQLLSER